MSPRLSYRALAGVAVLGLLPQLNTVPANAHQTSRANASATRVLTANLAGASSAKPSQLPGAMPTAATATPAAATDEYVVKAGDTLSRIARTHHTSIAAIVQANHLSNPNRIVAGTMLQIPRKSASATVPNTFLGRTYPEPVVSAANQNKASLDALPMPSRGQSRALIQRTARDMGVDPALALAISYQESGFNARAVSPANAIGLMQVIPSSGTWAAQLVGRPLNLLKAEDNVTAGVAIIRQLLRSADSVDEAIAGYYQGLASVRNNGMFADTKLYVAAVKKHREIFR